MLAFLNRLFGSSEPPQDTQTDARSVVYDFAHILAQMGTNLQILDTKFLRHSKSVIRQAFVEYMAELRIMRRAEELDEVMRLYPHVCKFQDIDPEDRQLVVDINSGKRFAKYRNQENSHLSSKTEDADALLFTNTVWKYRQRSLDEELS
ncbi:MAG: hypothetical protein R3F13_15260 [Prosthecobacter sp.]